MGKGGEEILGLEVRESNYAPLTLTPVGPRGEGGVMGDRRSMEDGGSGGIFGFRASKVNLIIPRDPLPPLPHRVEGGGEGLMGGRRSMEEGESGGDLELGFGRRQSNRAPLYSRPLFLRGEEANGSDGERGEGRFRVRSP